MSKTVHGVDRNAPESSQATTWTPRSAVFAEGRIGSDQGVAVSPIEGCAHEADVVIFGQIRTA